MKGQELIGITAANLMDVLDKDSDESAEILEVMVVVMVHGDGDDDDNGFSYVQYRTSDPNWVHQLGLAHAVIESMQASRGRFHLDEEDDQ